MSFEKLGLRESILAAVIEKGYKSPTEIQKEAIPAVLEERDVVASAQTGTGKTAAFALPLLSILEKHSGTRVLVLEPTRELAHQVADQFKTYGKNTNLKVALLYGGVGYGAQREQIKGNPDVIVATPGRLLDFMQQRLVNLHCVEHLVLDEVDRMLDMGFFDDVTKIVKACPPTRQTLLFSATMPDSIRRLIAWALKNPVDISIGVRASPAETIEHCLYPLDPLQRFDFLVALLDQSDFKSLIIFARTKLDVERIARWLEGRNFSAITFHADRNQRERNEALAGFKSGKYKILVATDLAARGLDISGVSHVINFNVPENPEDYVHRIGRTGRASTSGQAFTIFSADELGRVLAIEKLIGQKIERRKLDEFPYRHTPLLNERSATPRRRNR